MKKNLRIIIPLFIVLVLILILVIYFFEKPRLSYVYSDEYEGYLVDKCYGNNNSYTIPDKVNNKPVVGINQRAFYRKKKLEEVVFENKDNIKYIGKLALSECDNLKKIDLSNVEYIERNAFAYDYNLDNVTLSIKDINTSTFYKCTSLKNIELLNGVESIGSLAFSYTIIEELTLPESFNVLYVDALLYMNDLKKVNVKTGYTKSISYLESLNITINYY